MTPTWKPKVTRPKTTNFQGNRVRNGYDTISEGCNRNSGFP
jgi:hypothetical protein